MSNYKMKSFLKGLRYISQIFENEKEPEMQIGTPRDVKHVAHIGWDGGSANQNSPSWMNGFKSSGGYASTPLGNYIIEDDASCISEDSTRSHDIPRSSRDGTINVDSPIIGRSPRGDPKTSRRSKETCDNPSKNSRRKRSKDCGNGGSSRSSCRTRGSQTESIKSDAESMISISSVV